MLLFFTIRPTFSSFPLNNATMLFIYIQVVTKEILATKINFMEF